MDPTLRGGAADNVGKWTVVNGEIRYVRGAEQGVDNSIALSFPLPADPEPGDIYELWDQEYTPVAVHSIIDQAIETAQDNDVYEPVNLDEEYAAPYSRRISVPTVPEPTADEPNRRVPLKAVAYIDCEDYLGWGYGVGVNLWTELAQAQGVEVDNATFGFQSLTVPAGTHILQLPAGYSWGLHDRFGLEFHAQAAGWLGPTQDAAEADRRPFKAGWSYRGLPRQVGGGLEYSFHASAPISVVQVVVFQESSVMWKSLKGWTVWEGSGEVDMHREMGTAGRGSRLRIRGGKALPKPTSDDDLLPEQTPTIYLRSMALVTLLRSLGRGQQEAVVSREWESRAELELAALPRMQNARRV